MMDAENSGYKFIFVGGLHRSGTSAIYKLLGSDPEVSIFRNTGVIEDEGQFLQDIMDPDSKYGGPGLFALMEKAHLTEQSAIVSRARKPLFRQWAKHWDLEKPILAEKTPSNLIRSRFLQAVFPNTSFLFVMRHPIAVCMATTKWTGTYMTTLIEHWVEAHTLLFRDMEYLDCAAVLRYEDFTQCPHNFEEEFAKVLGKSPDIEWDMIKNGCNDKHYYSWNEGEFHLKDNFSMFKWWLKKSRNRLEVASIKRKFEPIIRQFGYSFDEFL